jgi:hypothetical protein
MAKLTADQIVGLIAQCQRCGDLKTDDKAPCSCSVSGEKAWERTESLLLMRSCRDFTLLWPPADSCQA